MEGLYVIAGIKARMLITVHAMPNTGREVGFLVTTIVGLFLTNVLSLALAHFNHLERISTG